MTTDTATSTKTGTGTDTGTGTRTDTGTPGLVEPDSTRVQQLDPAELVLDANVRHDAAPDRAMVASVREHGVLQPIIAFATGDGRARVRFGHRRARAAIAAERATVPVIVHPTSAAADEAASAAAEVDRIAQQSVENTHRQGLSAAAPSKIASGASLCRTRNVRW